MECPSIEKKTSLTESTRLLESAFLPLEVPQAHKGMTDDDQRVMGMSDQVAVEAEHPETVTFTRIHESDIELHCYMLSQSTSNKQGVLPVESWSHLENLYTFLVYLYLNIMPKAP